MSADDVSIALVGVAEICHVIRTEALAYTKKWLDMSLPLVLLPPFGIFILLMPPDRETLPIGCMPCRQGKSDEIRSLARST